MSTTKTLQDPEQAGIIVSSLYNVLMVESVLTAKILNCFRTWKRVQLSLKLRVKVNCFVIYKILFFERQHFHEPNGSHSLLFTL